MTHPKLTPDRLRREAIVYIRQSTPTQVLHHQESQRRQYGLAQRARELGFHRITVIDEDLGRTGSGVVERTGFQRLVAHVCSGDVGAVLCLEASRLARNGRDWHHLIELCGMVGAVLIDPDGIYDPSLLNDRLLLGLNRPDSYSTSYSTSHGSVNLLEILLGIRLQLPGPRATPSRPQICFPCAAT